MIFKAVQNQLYYFILAVSILYSFHSHAAFEDFVCPDGFICPEEIMPEVEFWVHRYGNMDKTQMIVYDNKYKNIYSHYQCSGECEKDPNRKNERTRIEKILASVLEKMRADCFDEFTQDEQIIYDSIQTVKDFKLSEMVYDRHKKKNVRVNAEDRLVHAFGHREAFINGLPIYKEYRNYIIESLQKNGFPLAIQFLPFAESGYDPFISSDAGAAGLWQLMPDVAVKHGLVVHPTYKDKFNHVIPPYPAIDERQDPIKATDTAMEYFKEAYKCLGGVACEKDFDPNDPILGPLIMTSYIYGINGTEKAMQKIGVDYIQIRDEHKDEDFGPYCKGYYPKFLGVYYVATHEEVFFGQIVEAKNKIDSKLLKLNVKTKPQTFTEMINTNVQTLQTLPWNMRYTDFIWKGKQFIPAGEPVELPFFEDDSIFANLGTVIDFPKAIN